MRHDPTLPLIMHEPGSVLGPHHLAAAAPEIALLGPVRLLCWFAFARRPGANQASPERSAAGILLDD